MITRLVSFITDGARYVYRQPQFLLTLLLIAVIPAAFLVSSLQFINASKDIQEPLEKDRIGLLHDVFLSVVRATNIDTTLIQSEIEELSKLNPDFVVFRIVKKTENGYVTLAALDTDRIGEVESEPGLYDFAYARPQESIVDDYFDSSGERYLRGIRLFTYDGSDFVILTLTSRAAADTFFAARLRSAYIWLSVLLAVVMALVLRHVFLVNYGYLYRDAQKAIATKDMFTNMIAHELRAPLTAMRGYASMIRENAHADERIREQAQRIEESSERLVVIVSDLLDVARIQSGKLAITKGDVDVSDVIRSVTDALALSAQEKNIALVSEGTGSPIVIQSDGRRLHQALTNLVSNAIKYTPKGSITVSLEKRKERVELRVKDTGMGIQAEDQKKLFAPFFRVMNKDVSSITGTGLGMWITMQLIELLGGSIGVESIKGVGTHIVVTLPTQSGNLK